jgi:hypothetical protein
MKKKEIREIKKNVKRKIRESNKNKCKKEEEQGEKHTIVGTCERSTQTVAFLMIGGVHSS